MNKTLAAAGVALFTLATGAQAQQTSPSDADFCLQAVFDGAQQGADAMAKYVLHSTNDGSLIDAEVEIEFAFSENDVNELVAQCERDYRSKITEFSSEYTDGDGYTVTGQASLSVAL